MRTLGRIATAVVACLALAGLAGCAITSTGSTQSSDDRFTFDVTFFCGEVGKRIAVEIVVGIARGQSTIRFTTEDDQGEKKGEDTRPVTPDAPARATLAAPFGTASSVTTMRLYEGSSTKELAKIEIEAFEDCQDGDARTIVIG